MKKRIEFSFIICFFALVLMAPAAEKSLEIKMEKVAELGGGEFMFHSIDSVCEDNEGNLYVLDCKAYKVHKFSPKGKRLLSFGNKGKGPGDFAYPHYITISEDEKIVVCEVNDVVSFFQKNGTFIEQIRVRVKGFVSLTYINPDLYFAWGWRPKVRQQALLNGKGEIIKELFAVSRDVSSVAAPDESGRLVSTGYSADEYTPEILESFNKNRAVFALSSRYKILVAIPSKNNSSKKLPGYTFTEIVRDTEPGAISAKEKKVFIDRINAQRYIYPVLKKAFIKKIPVRKNYFDRILVSEKHLFVFRIKEDITLENSPVSVDVFTLRGDFLGSVDMPGKACCASGRTIYFIRELEEDLLLVKYNYKLNAAKN